jgi:hypothetical protein
MGFPVSNKTGHFISGRARVRRTIKRKPKARRDFEMPDVLRLR